MKANLVSNYFYTVELDLKGWWCHFINMRTKVQK